MLVFVGFKETQQRKETFLGGFEGNLQRMRDHFKEKTTKFQKNKEKTLDKKITMWYSISRKSGNFAKMRVFVWFLPKTNRAFCAR